MAEQVIKRMLFGMNGQRLENFCIAKRDVFEKWKNGELLFFPEEMCFASIEMTEEREKMVGYLFDTENKRDDEWYKKWEAMSIEEKSSWYSEFIRNNYVTVTYDECISDDRFVPQDINVTFHLENRDVDGIIFFTIKPTGDKIEV